MLPERQADLAAPTPAARWHLLLPLGVALVATAVLIVL